MDVRTTGNPLIRGAGRALKRVNDRHPWSHNQHFHRWILRSLPDPCTRVLDVGCGRGDLVTVLAAHGHRVDGIDPDAAMAAHAAQRFREDPGVRITRASLEQFAQDVAPSGDGVMRDDELRDDAMGHDAKGYDAITMVASLHHMDLEQALHTARDLLRPGGRLLVVALTAPRGLVDTVWDVGNALTNPLIGLVKHPRPAAGPRADDDMPVQDAGMDLAELRRRTRAVLPGATLRRREGFRVTLAWQRPPG